MIDRVRFVAGTKVEDLSLAASEGAAAAKDLATGEPADEHELVWLGDIKELAVHLGCGKFDVFFVEAIQPTRSTLVWA